ncbi:MAG: cytochrome c biogenesis protein CcsA [Proteobacteria bacterium]|nr:cytochrome c biogenesis protein CcsA [Pseudomonadota bacterium]
MERLVYILAIFAYSYTTFAHFFPGSVGQRLVQYARAVALVGIVAHLTALVLTAFWSEHTSGGFPGALSMIAVGVAIAYVIVGTKRMQALGMLLAPLALVLLGTALVVPRHEVSALETTIQASPWLPIHMGLVFSGIAGFALSFAVGILYLWVRHRLKNKRFSGLGNLPSLEKMDRIQYRAMLFGFIFLTLGIGAGGIWASVSPIVAWTFDPKVVFTLMIWLWYGIALQLRLAGRRGHWTATFSVVGFLSLLFSLVGVNFLLSGWHGYGG